jgi:hypothetical protein
VANFKWECEPGLNMSQKTDFPLPPDLPRPVDDGAAKHLVGLPMPKIRLSSTAGRMVDVSADLPAARTVSYFCPTVGISFPGARGCTAQTCGFRDHRRELGALHADVFGLSRQRAPVGSSQAPGRAKHSSNPSRSQFVGRRSFGFGSQWRKA